MSILVVEDLHLGFFGTQIGEYWAVSAPLGFHPYPVTQRLTQNFAILFKIWLTIAPAACLKVLLLHRVRCIYEECQTLLSSHI
jgi:hypothetical protein